MDIHRYPLISMDIHGCPCMSMDICGYPWIFTDKLEDPRTEITEVQFLARVYVVTKIVCIISVVLSLLHFVLL